MLDIVNKKDHNIFEMKTSIQLLNQEINTLKSNIK